MIKGMGGLLAPWRFWCAAPRIPIGDLGNVLYALLVGVSIFFCEPELVRMLTEPDD
jgi:hypothetical protein